MFAFSNIIFAKALVDSDVVASVKPRAFFSRHLLSSQNNTFQANISTPVIIFAKSQDQVPSLARKIQQLTGEKVQSLHFMPAIITIIPKNQEILNIIANDKAVAQISLNKAGAAELEASAQAVLLRPSNNYPQVNNWWQAGFTGHSGVVGMLDSGVAIEHQGLSGKTIIVNDSDSEYARYKNGVRTAHGTGVACIYAGIGSSAFPFDVGIAYGVSTIVAGIIVDHDDMPENLNNDDVAAYGEKEMLSFTSTLDWMLTRAPAKATVINYSFGNGLVSCPLCTDWSGIAKIVDYVVNHEKILWVKSAGNKGFPEAANKATLTSPADNYNALTVANMNAINAEDRTKHFISYKSSRGPTLNGRRKPDITAPGNGTRTCAPDPLDYQLKFSPSMDFHDGYRLMGGTSSAAPHVGGAILLLQDAGIKEPMAAKALLINSADAMTDSGVPGPEDPNHLYSGGHFTVMGSEWNPTYGWGYMNMQKAYEQRLHIFEDTLTLNESRKEYKITLPVGGKVTLVHERRVGFNANNTEWRLSHLSLELYNADTRELLAKDDSPIDTVHQVANCVRRQGEPQCLDGTKTINAIVVIKLLSVVIDGIDAEPYALVYE